MSYIQCLNSNCFSFNCGKCVVSSIVVNINCVFANVVASCSVNFRTIWIRDSTIYAGAALIHCTKIMMNVIAYLVCIVCIY